MNFPKTDFSIGIHNHKSQNDSYHANILALARENGALVLEELVCLYNPVNEIVGYKSLVHYSGAKQIEQYLKQRKQAIPPFRISLQSKDAKLFFQGETHFEQGKKDRCLHIYPRGEDGMSTLKQLKKLADEIAGENIASCQLTALEQLSDRFSNQYDIQIVVSSVFLRYISYEVDALNIWEDIRGILHGGKIPKAWPCRKESYVELQLTKVASDLFYSIAFETLNILTAGNRRPKRDWIISERIGTSESFEMPIFQSDAYGSILNGKEVTPERMKSRLAECRHLFAKEILLL